MSPVDYLISRTGMSRRFADKHGFGRNIFTRVAQGRLQSITPGSPRPCGRSGRSRAWTKTSSTLSTAPSTWTWPTSAGCQNQRVAEPQPAPRDPPRQRPDHPLRPYRPGHRVRSRRPPRCSSFQTWPCSATQMGARSRCHSRSATPVGDEVPPSGEPCRCPAALAQAQGEHRCLM